MSEKKSENKIPSHFTPWTPVTCILLQLWENTEWLPFPVSISCCNFFSIDRIERSSGLFLVRYFLKHVLKIALLWMPCMVK